MSDLSKRVLFWTPRVLSVVYIAFLSVFALDVFGENLPFWLTVQHLIIHLIPCFGLLAVLILAWRWEWIGALFYTIWGLFYVVWVASVARPWSPAMRLNFALVIAGPALVTAVLFLVDWFKHAELRTPSLHAH
ncbi:MAG TPA: hypothetical protein VLY23_14215 [Candidatus Acidoferrum sp.]|nr:hypothetical protein [Candidatus Acidoferrum sp.]